MYVRRGEWKKGMCPVRVTFFCPNCESGGELDRAKPTAVYCGSGYRASIATAF
jgi:rhodanese-related sulfurtransferase